MKINPNMAALLFTYCGYCKSSNLNIFQFSNAYDELIHYNLLKPSKNSMLFVDSPLEATIKGRWFAFKYHNKTKTR